MPVTTTESIDRPVPRCGRCDREILVMGVRDGNGTLVGPCHASPSQLAFLESMGAAEPGPAREPTFVAHDVWTTGKKGPSREAAGIIHRIRQAGGRQAGPAEVAEARGLGPVEPEREDLMKPLTQAEFLVGAEGKPKLGRPRRN